MTRSGAQLIFRYFAPREKKLLTLIINMNPHLAKYSHFDYITCFISIQDSEGLLFICLQFYYKELDCALHKIQLRSDIRFDGNCVIMQSIRFNCCFSTRIPANTQSHREKNGKQCSCRFAKNCTKYSHRIAQASFPYSVRSILDRLDWEHSTSHQTLYVFLSGRTPHLKAFWY